MRSSTRQLTGSLRTGFGESSALFIAIAFTLSRSLLPYSVGRDTFAKLIELIKDDPVFENQGRRPQAPVRYQLACYLIRFGNIQNVKTATVLQLSEGSMYNHIRRVTQAFRNLRDLYIRWPGEEERRTIRREAQTNGFPGAVGAVDGSYIPITDKPRKNPMAFRCRKKFWAVSDIYCSFAHAHL
jgi:hypothetical protein